MTSTGAPERAPRLQGYNARDAQCISGVGVFTARQTWENREVSPRA